MYRILIVDDEPGISQGLKTLIERQSSLWEVIGMEYNGINGTAAALCLQPDLIITDISMPQMDGLEMIRALKAEKCKAAFILLSGYSEFEYAKQAMGLGVKHYITKPVEEDELFEAIESVIRGIEEERMQALMLKSLESTVQTNAQRLQMLLLRDILDSMGDGSASIEELLESCDFPISHQQYVCAMLRIELHTLDFEWITKSIQAHFFQYANVLALPYGSQQYAIVISHPTEIEEEPLIKAFTTLNLHSGSEKNIQYVIGLGLRHDQVKNIGRSLEQARQALDYRVLNPNATLLYYRDIHGLDGNQQTVSDEDILRLEACIESMDAESASDVIDEIFKKLWVQKGMSLSDLQMQCLFILLSGVRKMPSIQLPLKEFLGKDILSLETISRFNTLEQLRNWLVNVIHSIIGLIGEKKIPQKKDIITEIKQYICDHYEEDLNLSDLANRFFFNPYYLSQLFKERTGESYLNYLTTLRINKAKELIVSTDLRIHEICKMIGYSDASYFSRLFEKKVGSKPTEYRKSRQER